jgi:predicted DNA-binding transcriptional regulator YafY
MIEYISPFLSKRGIRVLEIHSLLRSLQPISREDLMARLSESDGATNGAYGIRTFREDVKFLKEVLDAPLVISNRGEYSYSEKFSVFPNFAMIDQDVEILENIASATGKYEDLPFFSEFNQLLKKINPNYKRQEIVGFEGPPVRYGGIEHFEDIFWSIQQNRKLHIEYQRFGGSPIYGDVEPYYLKEYQHRWYLIGYASALNGWRTYSLDRIKVIEEFDEDSFSKRKEFDPSIRWKYSVGIIALEDDPVEFSFELKDGDSYWNIDYLKTLPIHWSQVIEDKKGPYVKVKLLVHPTIELFRELRKLGQKNIKNIHPKKYSKLVWEG